MKVSEKQVLAFKIFDNPVVVDGVFGGGAGGGKSITVTEWAIIQCKKYPGIRIGIGRNEISNLRRTTIQTLLKESHPLLGVKERDYKYHNLINPRIDYSNGSEITFVDLAYSPADPDYDRLGSMNFTHTIIEEMGEVHPKARAVFSSRKNRYLNKKYGITGKSFGTCNPTRNFVRQEYYDQYMLFGGGGYQMWPIVNDDGDPVFVYLEDGSKVPAMRFFIKSLVTDNPFISKNYIEELKSKPRVDRRRLLDGDWDFYKDANSLFKRHLFVRSDITESTDIDYAGCDPSMGGDGCTFVHLRGKSETVDGVTKTIRASAKDIYKLEIPDEKDGNANYDKGTFIAREFIKFCIKHGVDQSNAAVDTVGVGQTVGDACARLGFDVNRFNAGSNTGVRYVNDDKGFRTINQNKIGTPLFNNIRSQNFYDMADAAEKGKLTFAEDLPYSSDLFTELEAHGFETKNEKITIYPKNGAGKNTIKAILGHSPDFADGLQAAWWCMNHKQNISKKSMFRV